MKHWYVVAEIRSARFGSQEKIGYGLTFNEEEFPIGKAIEIF